uniref:Complex 1 LYR protein domain-containing protein n=2 Tax=Callithrix jacchus TaxID=9483 RepID=A0A5F4WEK5_CALJA
MQVALSSAGVPQNPWLITSTPRHRASQHREGHETPSSRAGSGEVKSPLKSRKASQAALRAAAASGGGESAVKGGPSARRPSVTLATQPPGGTKGRCALKHKCPLQDPGRFAKALRGATAVLSDARASDLRPPGAWLDAPTARPLVSPPFSRLERLLGPEPPAGGWAERRHLPPGTAPLAAPRPACARLGRGPGCRVPSAVLRGARLAGKAEPPHFISFVVSAQAEVPWVGLDLGPLRRGPVCFFLSKMAASSRAQVLDLYRAMLRESKRFSAYNYRTYAVRRIRDAFRENKNVKDPVEIQTLVNKAKRDLGIIRRQETGLRHPEGMNATQGANSVPMKITPGVNCTLFTVLGVPLPRERKEKE